MLNSLPSQAEKYFWGDDLNQLNWADHQVYITQTLLDKGDLDSISWLFKQSSKNELFQLLPKLKMSPRSANFWKVYLS